MAAYQLHRGPGSTAALTSAATDCVHPLVTYALVSTLSKRGRCECPILQVFSHRMSCRGIVSGCHANIHMGHRVLFDGACHTCLCLGLHATLMNPAGSEQYSHSTVCAGEYGRGSARGRAAAVHGLRALARWPLPACVLAGAPLLLHGAMRALPQAHPAVGPVRARLPVAQSYIRTLCSYPTTCGCFPGRIQLSGW